MNRQIQEAYIVAATRTPVGKAPRGMFRNTRPVPGALNRMRCNYSG